MGGPRSTIELHPLAPHWNYPDASVGAMADLEGEWVNPEKAVETADDADGADGHGRD
jgi:hypothetical protein